MRAITAALVVMLSGCFLPPPPGFGGVGSTGEELKIGSTEQMKYCSAVEDFGFGKNVEGTWQDYAGSFDVLSLEGGTATLRKISAEGQVSVDATGTYTLDGSKVTLSWSDGRVETIDAYVEDIPGCEMLSPRDVRGESPRLNEGMYFERVRCDFSGSAEAGAPQVK